MLNKSWFSAILRTYAQILCLFSQQFICCHKNQLLVSRFSLSRINLLWQDNALSKRSNIIWKLFLVTSNQFLSKEIVFSREDDDWKLFITLLIDFIWKRKKNCDWNIFCKRKKIIVTGNNFFFHPHTYKQKESVIFTLCGMISN